MRTDAIFKQLDLNQNGRIDEREAGIAKDGKVVAVANKLVGLDKDGFDGVIKKLLPATTIEQAERQLEHKDDTKPSTGQRVANIALGVGAILLQILLLPFSILMSLPLGIASAATHDSTAIKMAWFPSWLAGSFFSAAGEKGDRVNSPGLGVQVRENLLSQKALS